MSRTCRNALKGPPAGLATRRTGDGGFVAVKPAKCLQKRRIQAS